jgi:hypothetical protein
MTGTGMQVRSHCQVSGDVCKLGQMEVSDSDILEDVCDRLALGQSDDVEGIHVNDVLHREPVLVAEELLAAARDEPRQDQRLVQAGQQPLAVGVAGVADEHGHLGQVDSPLYRQVPACMALFRIRKRWTVSVRCAIST